MGGEEGAPASCLQGPVHFPPRARGQHWTVSPPRVPRMQEVWGHTHLDEERQILPKTFKDLGQENQSPVGETSAGSQFKAIAHERVGAPTGVPAATCTSSQAAAGHGPEQQQQQQRRRRQILGRQVPG